MILNANLAFLAIQSVDVNTNPYRSPAQISSYLSVTANIGSIVLGLFLMRQNRMEIQMVGIVSHFPSLFFLIYQYTQQQEFLASCHHPLLGLKTFAILYSLPYALLMWGYVHLLYTPNS